MQVFGKTRPRALKNICESFCPSTIFLGYKLTRLKKLKYLNNESYLPNKNNLPINIIDIDMTFYKQNTFLMKNKGLLTTFDSKLQQ